MRKKSENERTSQMMKLEFSTRRLELRNQRLELVVWRLERRLEKLNNVRKL